MKERVLIMALLVACACIGADAARPFVAPPEGTEVLPLWPGGTKDKPAAEDLYEPTLAVFPAPADTATGAAVIVCPGGGYGGLAIDYEGYEVAQMFNRNGVSAFVLRYRVAPWRHPAPLNDAQRAVRIVRSRAAEWGIRPDRIGMLGFSAGGHLVSTAGTHFDNGTPDAKEPVDRVGCRPDFLFLIYPVITFKSPVGHAGSGKNLLGENPDPALVDLLANDEQVTPQTPPSFLVHSYADSAVPAENSIQFYLALRRAGVPAEMHLYEKGEHGYGMGKGDPVLSTWPGHAIDWMKTRGLLGK